MAGTSPNQFRYEYYQGGKTCQLRRSLQNGIGSFEAEYDSDDRVVRVTDPAGLDPTRSLDKMMSPER